MARRMPISQPTTPTVAGTLGWIDEPRDEGIVGPRVRVAGWALALTRVRAVEVRLGNHAFRARYGLRRDDVAAVHPGYPDHRQCGFAFEADLSACPAPRDVDRRTLTIVAIAGDGSETELGRRSLVEASAHGRWRFVGSRGNAPFYVIPGLSGVASGGAFGLESRYSAYLSPTTRIGMRVPILYLRTTTGAADDYRFDANFDVSRRCGARAVADDALSHALDYAKAAKLPVLVTLNGGIWADAAGTCPEWDINDRLEEDPANCQWNERNEVLPDDYLAHLPGSQHAPELARALTLNVYAGTVRNYKRRNLQQAAGHLALFMREHDDGFIGVNLDPDVYINPFFGEACWYDYNPGTLAQFRHWLAGSGPYAGEFDNGVPDLSGYRRAIPLPLADVRDIARRSFVRWEEVDPPRVFSRDAANPYWRDPWVREWEHFRRHLVALHYDELARWLVDAGIARNRIWSSQGLMAPAGDAMPLALSITSPVKNHDSGGVSIEGSKPRDGHLGAIVYGSAATNDIAMENGRSLYATLGAVDPDFGIVEFNTADLRHPARPPAYADAYRALRDLWNCGARFVSPMAWNGANGIDAGRADYVAYTAWRNTPLEQATCDFLLARCGLPRGARLWTFGTPAHADDDRWQVEAGSLQPLPGGLALTANQHGGVVLVSPRDVALASRLLDTVVLGIDVPVDVDTIDIALRSAPDAPWQPFARLAAGGCPRTAAGVLAQRTSPLRDVAIDQLRLGFSLARHARMTLRRVAILTSGSAR